MIQQTTEAFLHSWGRAPFPTNKLVDKGKCEPMTEFTLDQQNASPSCSNSCEKQALRFRSLQRTEMNISRTHIRSCVGALQSPDRTHRTNSSAQGLVAVSGKLGVPYFGVLVRRILLFRVLSYRVPYFRKLPCFEADVHCLHAWKRRTTNNLPTQVCCKDKLMARGGRITGVLGILGPLSRQNMT